MKRRIRIRTLLTAALLLGLGLSGLARGGDALRLFASGNDDRPGGLRLTLRHIAVTGQVNSNAGRLEDILDDLRGRQVSRSDIEAAQVDITSLPWIADARLTLQLPDRLEVTLREHAAFAVWQRNGRHYLVDRTGHVLMSDPPRRWFELPVVIGEDAANAAATLLDRLDKLSGLRARLRSATYIAGRRWTLQLNNGVTVALPDDEWPADAYGLDAALNRLNELDSRYWLEGRAISRIDLRFADRIILRRLPGTVIADTAREHST